MTELKGVGGGYGKKTVVKDVSAVFENGTTVSVVGANGCGKSTLLMLCAGLLPVSCGRVFADGEDISLLSRKETAKRISFLAQRRSIGSMTVRSLVSHGRFPYLGYPRRYTAHDRDMIDAAMEKCGIMDIGDRLLCELSGGQQQRAGIAMVLAQDTGNILLDEPMTYLDIGHKLELAGLISDLRDEGKTVVTVMHDLELALDISDKVAVMQNGAFIAMDTPRNIADSDALGKALGVRAVYHPGAGRYFFEPYKQ